MICCRKFAIICNRKQIACFHLLESFLNFANYKSNAKYKEYQDSKRLSTTRLEGPYNIEVLNAI